MLGRLDLGRRAVAAALHLLISGAVAACAAVLMFGAWYPGPFRLLAGGRDLFLLVIAVDVVLGPALTFAVFNVAKSPAHLRRDLGVIGLIQAAALIYGLHTVYIVRPVAMVFEVDRFRLVTAYDVPVNELPMALPQYRSLPTTGPWLLGTRTPQRGSEHNDALFAGLRGLDRGYRPLFWQPYEQSRADVMARSKPLVDLLRHYQARATELRQRLSELESDEDSGRFLPVIARGEWVAILDKTGRLLGYLPVDGYI